MRGKIILLLLLCGMMLPRAAHADFIITSAIVEFTATGPRQQDIEIVSQSNDNQYIVAEVSEIIHPGAPDETRRIVKDPAHSMLLVTPDKTILAASSRKVMRFVLLQDPDAAEHIYRVAIKPVIKGVNNQAAVGLKILVGYEVLVIIRPAAPQVHFTAARQGATLLVNNTGNTNVLLQNGQQCMSATDCKPAPATRVYANSSANITLPLNAPVTYTIWDGTTTNERRFE